MKSSVKNRIIELTKHLAQKNVNDGFPHFNHLGWCYSVAKKHWPELAKEFYLQINCIKAETCTDNNIGDFISSWRAICRELRRWHLQWADINEKKVSEESAKSPKYLSNMD